MEIYDVYHDHHIHHRSISHRLQSQSPPSTTNDCDEVLDLSRRCDSVETRKTPSPYATGSSLGADSPSTQCGSPSNSTITLPNSLLSHERESKKSVMMPSLPPYPIYYPVIKQENNSPPSSKDQTINQSFPDTTRTTLMGPMDLMKPISLISEQIQKTFSPNNYERSLEVKSPISERLVENLPLSSTTTVPLIYPKILMNDGKPTRPFKAFPRDPLVIAANFAATDVLYDGPRVERYTEYRKRVLEQIRSANGGQRTVTNPKMRRSNSRNSGRVGSDNMMNNENHANSSESEDRCTESSDNDASSSTPSTTNNKNSNNNNNNNPAVLDQNKNGVIKDAAYYERRRKNNAAAKKSRDRRRIKEDEIAIRAAYLERQNIELLCQLDALKAQLASLTKQQC